MSDVDLFGDFPPGTEVCRANNPSMSGTVTDRTPLLVGKIVRVYVKWSDNKVAPVPLKFLQKVEQTEQDLSALDELSKGNYGKVGDLRDALLGYRLGGTLNDNIYSLNITKTHFYPYQFKPLFTFFDSLNDSLLIADEVGLGKTIEAGLIWTELRMRQQAQRLLVVCPAQLCEKWAFELSDKFGVEADIVDAKGLADFITKFCVGKVRSGALIASLPSIRAPKDWECWPADKIENKSSAFLSSLLKNENIRSDVFNLFILDEAHHIRNEETQSHKIVADLRSICESTLFLSATPIQTSDENLFSLLHVLDPKNYPYRDSLSLMIYRNRHLVELIDAIANQNLTARDFKDQFENVQLWGQHSTEATEVIEDLKRGKYTKAELSKPKVKVELIKKLNRLNPLSQIVTRTMKRHVLTEGRVTRRANVLSINLSPVENDYYGAVTEAIIQYCQHTRTPAPLIVSGYQRLLSSCLPASLEYWASNDIFDKDALDDEEGEQPSGNADQNVALRRRLGELALSFDQTELRKCDSKYRKLLETIYEQQKSLDSSRMIVFSFFKGTLRYLQDRLTADGIRCERIDGDIPRDERYQIIEKFKSGAFDILLSSEVAAEGVDLQFVSTLVNYDLPWNPAKIEQRIGRIDRIGQLSPVIRIFNMVYQGTIEQHIHDRLLERLHVFERALGVTEVFLGEEVRKLTLDLFSQKLTPEEQEKRIDSVRLAIEHEKDIVQSEAGQSMVYDLISQELETARRLERYILDDDLLAFVKGFCDKGPGKSQLYKEDDNTDYYKLALSAEARAEFQHFLNETQSKLETTNLFINPDLLIRFHNKQGDDEPGVERITQNHPLIRFIAYWREKKNLQAYPTSSVDLEPSVEDLDLFKDIPDGNYAYSTQFWEYRTKGMSRRKAKLAFAAINIETCHELEPEQAEALITRAARFGNTLSVIPKEILDPLLDAASKADCTLTDEQERYAKDCLEETLREASFKRQSLLCEKDRIFKQKYEVLKKLNPEIPRYKGLHDYWEKKYNSKLEDLHTRIASINLTTEIVLNNLRTVSMGLIRLRRK